MKHRKRNTLFFLLALFAAALAASLVWYYNVSRLDQADLTLIRMTQDTKSGTVSLSSPWDVALATTIRYTTDGSAPTEASPAYKGPISVLAAGRNGVVIRAAAFQGAKSSRVYTETFFCEAPSLGTGICTVCLSGDPADFWSEETGILADGAATIDEANADSSLPAAPNNANHANFWGRGLAWERAAHVEIYDAEGTLVLQQDAGVRVCGRFSRDRLQKSLRLYARKRYDAQNGKFSVSLLSQPCETDGYPVTQYDQIDLRNGGNDWKYTMLTDSVARRLAAQSGLTAVAQAVPADVYLNGEYYGLAWLEASKCEKNIAALCGLSDADGIETAGDAEELSDENASLDSPEGTASLTQAQKDYQSMEALAFKDLTVPENAQALEQALDVNNCLLYYAFEMCINNVDWPDNNYRAWRYIGSDEDDLQNPYGDGRWRFLLYDSDLSFDSNAAAEERFCALLTSGKSPLLCSLLQNETYRAIFCNDVCDLMAGSLSAENVSAEMESARAEIEPEIAYRESTVAGQTLYAAHYADQVQADASIFPTSYREDAYAAILDFAAERPAQVLELLESLCGAEGRYSLSVSGDFEHAQVSLNSMSLLPGSGFSGTYFVNSPVQLSCAPEDGWAFVAWEVNGRRYARQTLSLDNSIAAADSSVTVRLILRQQASEVVLSCLARSDTERWVELKNPGSEPILLSGYSLSNDPDALQKDVLPAVTLAPGESIRFYAEDDNSCALGCYELDFKLKKGKTLYLSRSDGTLLEQVALPHATEEGSCYQKSANGWHYVGKDGTV